MTAARLLVLLAGVSISARVAIFADAALAVGLCASSVRRTLSARNRADEGDAGTEAPPGANQLAGSIAGLSPKIVEVIPADRDGLDGMIISGRTRPHGPGAGGRRAADARGMRRRGPHGGADRSAPDGVQDPASGTQSTAVGRLLPSSSKTTLLVAMVPRDGGVLATIYQVGWATDRRHSTMCSTALNLGGGAASCASRCC